MIPPIRFGIKNTVLNMLVPLMPLVSNIATAKASTLIVITDTTVKSEVYQRAWVNVASPHILI